MDQRTSIEHIKYGKQMPNRSQCAGANLFGSCEFLLQCLHECCKCEVYMFFFVLGGMDFQLRDTNVTNFRFLYIYLHLCSKDKRLMGLEQHEVK